MKAEAYGDLEHPYVIAVNAPDAWPVSTDGLWAAYGPRPFEAGWQRAGFLLREGGPPYEVVSAVLAGVSIQPHTVSRFAPDLNENPGARFRAPMSLRWPRIQATTAGMTRQAGISPSQLFELPPDWPPHPWNSDVVVDATPA